MMVIPIPFVEVVNSVTGAIFIVTCTAVAEANKPSKALTVKALIVLPKFAAV